jgi:dipeptidyl aminopeptidase/acylaminoacyl peptidase
VQLGNIVSLHRTWLWPRAGANRANLQSAIHKKWLLLATLFLLPGAWIAANAQPDDSPQQQRGGQGGRGGGERGVYKAAIHPHWLEDDIKFWYTNGLRGGAVEFILVDAEKAVRQPAFDHKKLAAALSQSAGQPFKPDHLPFSSIEFLDDGKAVQFEAAGKTWKCDLKSYQCTAVPNSENKAALLPPLPAGSQLVMADADLAFVPDESGPAAVPAADEQALSPQQQGQGQGGGRRGQSGATRAQDSPDGQWTAFVTNFNVCLRPSAGGGEIQLSQDGVSNNSYARLSWSPDSKTLVAWRVEPGDDGQVYLVESSPEGGGRAVLHQRSYPQDGDKMPAYELNVFDVESRKQIKPQVERVDYRQPFPRWNKDGSHFNFEKEDRSHTRFRVVDIEARTGAVRDIIDERARTFIWTENTDAFRGQLRPTTHLRQTEEIIYASEQDGWRHLYLYDSKEAKLKNQITKGPWVVRGIDRIDEESRQIWFEASGMNPQQNPYYLHYYRINFDGTGLIALTEGNGTHAIAWSPGRKYLIDTYSRLDLPPVNDLRRGSDGKLVCHLEQADISELKQTGWSPSETFVAKGRDGQTDIYGVIDRPRNFNPKKKYPILEDIYAGPQGTPSTTVPTAFSGRSAHTNYTGAGFIVVKIEGMGTANRSKAFQDVCWHNLADAGFPDRILWIKAAAAKYHYMDLSRVGIFGTSAGGQSAAGAVIFHPEFYKVAVANCGCHDNRLDKSTWNEQWMGFLPHEKIWSRDADNWFSQSSNIDNAARLGGKLFLLVGELDENVPPESTFRLVDALIKARKDFDLLVVPGAGHGAASPVTARRTLDYFVHNLLGQEPPNRNAGAVGAD